MPARANSSGRPDFEKNPHKKRRVEWLKVWALSSNPRNTKKKKKGKKRKWHGVWMLSGVVNLVIMVAGQGTIRAWSQGRLLRAREPVWAMDKERPQGL
jgi:hypothetical protein